MATIKTLLCSFLVLVSFLKIHFIQFTFPKIIIQMVLDGTHSKSFY